MHKKAALDWDHLLGRSVHMVGIKGNGMAALAATLHGTGARIAGSDVAESFFTDALLHRLGLEVQVGFDAAHVSRGAEVLIYSTAFDPARNPEIVEAARRGIPVLSYPEALGEISEQFDSSGVAGSHGKTTTTALCAVLCKALGAEATVLVPSLVADLDDMPVYSGGRRYFIAETCEHRRAFLNYRPRRIVLTTIEAEHLDYYRDFDDVCDAFAEYAGLLPADGLLIYNADDRGCRLVAERFARSGLSLVAYGREAGGEFRLTDVVSLAGAVRFTLAGSADPFELKIPGSHNAHNAAAALALVCSITGASLGGASADRLRAGLSGFRGCKRRVEILGTARGVLVIDDYGHHPTEIATTLAGLKAFYAGRRLVVDFMPHLFSRTRALFQDFLRAFGAADEVILHPIYASARERDDGTVTGRALAEEMAGHHPKVRYFDPPLDAVGYLAETLREGDVLVTMGAGDNWKVGTAVLERLRGAEAADRGGAP